MSFISVEKKDSGICYLTLNRPEIHNAFDEVLINELTTFFNDVSSDDSVSAVVMSGAGKSFCAGADLNWMKKMVSYSMEENLADSKNLAGMLSAMNNCQKPVVGLIDGATMGGGVGLASCFDFAVATTRSFFALSEVKLGILPAVISPFVISKIGESQARRFFISGERFSAQKAKEIGLVHEVAETVEQAESMIEEYVKQVMSSAPAARVLAKKLVSKISHELSSDQQKIDYACELIASVRVSDEGQEGMSALLEKRKPSWVQGK